MAIEPFIEKLTEMTDPEAGDFVSAFDNDAPAGDKDRRLNLSRLALLAQANTFLAANTFEAPIDVESDNVNTPAATFSGAAGQVVPVTLTDGNTDVRGKQYHFANPAIVLLGASNTGAGSSVAPRMAMVHLEMDYNGSNNESISPDVAIFGGGSTAADMRQMSILTASIAYRATAVSQARWVIYAPLALIPGGAYQSLTLVDTQTANTGYAWTAEIQGISNGNIRIRTTRTGGVTNVAKIHVSLLIAG